MSITERYNIILEKLLKSSRREGSLDEIQELANKLSKLSSRHHYLPRYYIEGFCGSDGKMAVYDKKNDSIQSIRKSPKSMFFELDRHTFEIDGLKISSLEEQLFSDTDSRLAPYILKLRGEPNTTDLLTTDIQANISVFLIDLFWRNPKTDDAAMDLIQRSKMTWVDESNGISFQDAERERKYKADPVNRKLDRFKMHVESMLQITKERLPGYTYSKLWEFKNGPFVLGDFPIIFSKMPQTHTDLAVLDHFLPISSNRLYACNQLAGLNFKISDALIINALQIDQAKSYIAASHNKILEDSIRFYHAAKKDGTLQFYKNYLFKKL